MGQLHAIYTDFRTWLRFSNVTFWKSFPVQCSCLRSAWNPSLRNSLNRRAFFQASHIGCFILDQKQPDKQIKFRIFLCQIIADNSCFIYKTWKCRLKLFVKQSHFVITFGLRCRKQLQDSDIDWNCKNPQFEPGRLSALCFWARTLLRNNWRLAETFTVEY